MGGSPTSTGCVSQYNSDATVQSMLTVVDDYIVSEVVQIVAEPVSRVQAGRSRLAVQKIDVERSIAWITMVPVGRRNPKCERLTGGDARAICRSFNVRELENDRVLWPLPFGRRCQGRSCQGGSKEREGSCEAHCDGQAIRSGTDLWLWMYLGDCFITISNINLNVLTGRLAIRLCSPCIRTNKLP